MRNFFRRLFPPREPAKIARENTELHKLLEDRQKNLALRLQRLEIEANLLHRGQAGSRG